MIVLKCLKLLAKGKLDLKQWGGGEREAFRNDPPYMQFCGKFLIGRSELIG